eukprot:Plantae.Rhodophyta-Rhodochaete_pulchella.ctg22150.p1 GENE.Plantae.Rhodophyta-Rhodochaete_pulchella.ctg22150~~Plantae.Rhodophyta-Rhodochaete_pulchella.ctg22150.p1  ORF type:complete len:194 (+),score=3.63 Plantae.Rhodophyta-Rhodochaete_pulchella.ctg22150:64-645(+)
MMNGKLQRRTIYMPVSPAQIGSIDSMKLHRKNTPKQYKRQYKNPKDGKLGVLTCEAWADHRLYCWSWFARRPGTNNNITQLDHSPLFHEVLEGNIRLDQGPYVLNGVARSWKRYFLADGIYPACAIFPQPIAGGGNSDKDRYTTRSSTKQSGRRWNVCLGFCRGDSRYFVTNEGDIVLILEACVQTLSRTSRK